MMRLRLCHGRISSRFGCRSELRLEGTKKVFLLGIQRWFSTAAAPIHPWRFHGSRESEAEDASKEWAWLYHVHFPEIDMLCACVYR